MDTHHGNSLLLNGLGAFALLAGLYCLAINNHVGFWISAAIFGFFCAITIRLDRAKTRP